MHPQRIPRAGYSLDCPSKGRLCLNIALRNKLNTKGEFQRVPEIRTWTKASTVPTRLAIGLPSPPHLCLRGRVALKKSIQNLSSEPLSRPQPHFPELFRTRYKKLCWSLAVPPWTRPISSKKLWCLRASCNVLSEGYWNLSFTFGHLGGSYLPGAVVPNSANGRGWCITLWVAWRMKSVEECETPL